MCHWRLSSLFITSTTTTVSPPCDCLSSALNNPPAGISNPSQSTSCCATRQSQEGQQNREK
ncbi:hypothetical protein M405DRAFT_813627 [Rhizopogon salebrosus TDB-379]|nr:hypothetical protein M405DRAFT_813627 [Rhizopogon salebrosus TDB-379]